VSVLLEMRCMGLVGSRNTWSAAYKDTATNRFGSMVVTADIIVHFRRFICPGQLAFFPATEIQICFGDMLSTDRATRRI
jgi:hypothetical protein